MLGGVGQAHRHLLAVGRKQMLVQKILHDSPGQVGDKPLLNESLDFDMVGALHLAGAHLTSNRSDRRAHLDGYFDSEKAIN